MGGWPPAAHQDSADAAGSHHSGDHPDNCAESQLRVHVRKRHGGDAMSTYEQALMLAVRELSNEIQRIGGVAHRLQEQIRTNQLPYSSLDGTDQLVLTDGVV